MKRKLQTYTLTLTAVGPVFVGSGKEISKKEYIRLKDGTVLVLDIEKFYSFIEKKHLEKQYLDFMLKNDRISLGSWILNQEIQVKDIQNCIRYRLKNSDMELEHGKPVQIMEYIKDPYGQPYIPGSSVKGMMRTILLCNDICEHPQKYERIAADMERELFQNRNQNVGRKRVLATSMKNTEVECYHLLNRFEKKRENAVNDRLSGIIIGDSKPLRTDDLTLCQKVEVHPDGAEKKLNLLRECIKPQTQIEMMLTIDTDLFPLDDSQMMKAIHNFNSIYNENFSEKFRGANCPSEDMVYLGGGAGFVSKTIIYALFQRTEGIKACQSIFEKTNVPRNHKHYKDMQYGVSPHILKSTYYAGKQYQMGQCRCKIERIE